MLFSATMPPPIEKLAKKFLNNPKRIEVSRRASTNENIAAFKVPVKSRDKRETLRWLLRNDLVETAIIFANRKTTVREINKSLQSHGFSSGEIHGDMDQASRTRELDRFKTGQINILVASDVAARGLDVKGVSHVFNYDTPWHPDDYVHRIGRTGRAGNKGRAFTFVSEEDAEAIANVEKLTQAPIPVFGKKDLRVELAAPETPQQPADDEREERAERPRRAREERGGRQRRDREDAVEAPVREREPRVDRPRGEKRHRHEEPDDAPSQPGEWNGPVPSFLEVGFG
jgi:superfamily II DNA/RNA helicase